MNDTVATPPDSLPLRDRRRPSAPLPPTRPLGPLEIYRGLRTNPITTWGQDAYEQPVIVARGFMGDHVVVNAPDGIRRIFLDNVANYRKDDLQLQKLKPGLGHGLLTSENDEWRFQRRTVAPLFQPAAVSKYFAEMLAAVETMLMRWDAAAEIGTVLGMSHEMMALTYEIISRTVFSSEIETSPDVMGAAVTRYFETHGRIDLWDFLKLPDWLPRPAQWRVRPATRVFRDEVSRLLDRRKARQAAGKALPQDLVTLLMAARDPETGGALSEKVIHDNLVTFIGAGHETTANALSWTLFLLSEFPWAFDRVAHEVDALLGTRTPALEDLARLEAVRMVLEESMRLYPPIPFLSRQAVAADRICGVPVKPGALVIVAPWLVHRHRTLWEEPDLFEPERFAPQRRAKIARFAYLPFGAGPRICIGAGFAIQEALLALALIVRRFRPCLVPGTPVEPVARITLRASNGLPMRLDRR